MHVEGEGAVKGCVKQGKQQTATRSGSNGNDTLNRWLNNRASSTAIARGGFSNVTQTLHLLHLTVAFMLRVAGSPC